MVEEVEVTNFGKGGVASEETLVDLLKAIEYLAKKEGFDPKKTAEKVKKLGENLDDTIDVVDDNRKALEENTDSVKDSTKAYKSMFGYLGNAIGVVGTSLVNFSAELIDGGSKLTDFTQHIPIVGSTLSKLTGYFDNTIDVFREISSVGGAMNNSLTDIRMAAAQTFMSLEEFGNFVVTNSSQLAVMGGTVTKGVKRLTELNDALGDQRLELLNMGYSYQEINETLVRYANLDRAGRRAQQVNVQQQALAAAEYAKNLSTLSKLTGEEIDSINDKVTAETQSIAFQQKLAKMDEGERQKVLQGMAEAAAMYGDAGAEYFKQQILGMPPLTEETQMLAAAFPEFASQIRGLASSARDSSVSLNAFNAGSTDRMVDAMRAAAESGEQFESLLAAGASGLDGPSTIIAGILEGMGKKFTDYTKVVDGQTVLDEERLRADIQSAKEESAKRDAMTNSFVSFEDTIRKAREEILTNFIDSGVFDLISDTVQSLADTISDPQFIGALKDAIIDVTNFLSGFIEDIKSGDFKTAIDNAFKNVGQVIKDFLFGMSGEERKSQATEEISNLSNQIANLNAERSNLAMFGADDPEMQKQIGLLDQRIARLSEQRQEEQTILQTPTQDLNTEGVFSGVGSLMSTMGASFFSGITDYFISGLGELFTGNLTTNAMASGIAGLWASKKVTDAASGFRNLFGAGTNVERGRESNQRGPTRGSRTAGGRAGTNIGGALGGLTGGIIEGVGNGLAAVGTKAPFVAAGAAAIGAAIVAIGAGIAGATWIMGAVLPTFAEGMKSFEDINGSKLVDAGAGMAAVAAGMAAFGAGSAVAGLGNLVGSVTEGLAGLFGGEDPMEKLQRFVSYDIDAARVENNARAIVAFSTALAVQGAGTAISGLGNLVGGIADGITSFFGGETGFPYDKIAEFARFNIDAARVEANANAMVAFNNALMTASAGTAVSGIATMVGAIGDFIGGLFGGDSPIEQVQEFGNMQINAEGVIANANAMAAMSTALSTMSSVDLSDVDIPNRLINRLASISELQFSMNLSQGLSALAQSLSMLSSVDASDINIPRSFVDSLRTVSEITGQGIGNVATGLERLVGVTGVREQLETINSGFNTDKITNYNTALQNLIETLEELNETMTQSDAVQSNTNADNISQATARGNGTASTDQLNTLMQKLYEEFVKANDFAKKIEKNTKSFGRDVSTGRVSDL